MTDHKFTDEELQKCIECCIKAKTWGDCEELCCPATQKHGCLFYLRSDEDYEGIIQTEMLKDALDLINRQKAEIERLEKETQKARRKALLEAKSKFAGHSDYHGDTILCKLICMAEGKEVGVATPLDKSEIKAEVVKEFAERLKERAYTSSDWSHGEHPQVVECDDIDDLVKEMTGGEHG